jgi:Ca2+-transporting ATPase
VKTHNEIAVLSPPLSPQFYPYAMTGAEAAAVLGVDLKTGLREAEITDRQKRYGRNTLQKIRQRPAWRIFVDQFLSLIVALLVVAALISFLTSDTMEAIAILVVLLLNAIIGFATEWQAGRALEALHKRTQLQARVRRDGQERRIDAAELVPGDIVILEAGDVVPADGRLLEAVSLFAEESALTGESATVEKSIEPVPADTLLAERHPMLYLGTTVARGRARLLVTATGLQTEMGRIGKLVAEADDETTPLEKRLIELGRRLVYQVLAIAVVVLVTGWLRGEGIWKMIEVAISLAVAAVPEGLPAVTTLVLALGVLRMARQRAIIRRLPAVETLGSATVICSDKTGTLTENRMAAREFYLADGRRVTPNNCNDEDGLYKRALRVGALCNSAFESQQSPDEWQTLGDPTETALLSVARTLVSRDEYELVAEIPFDAATRFMITVHKDAQHQHLASMKGAPAVVLAACSQYAASSDEAMPLDAAGCAAFHNVNELLAGDALRVLALAEKSLTAEEAENFTADPTEPRDFTFIGFVGLIDPPREEVPEAIHQAQQAGIRIVMLTGDQLHTAQAIARELRLNGDAPLSALHARDLEGITEENLAQAAQQTQVFARVSPQDKLRIVAALKNAGEVVAVTGDGINDAPALKRADIGIAMGLRGTDVAREAADVVLADDNFATIIKAIEGGRTIYANIIKFVQMMFSHNLGEVIFIFTAIVVGLPLPLLPLQILWMNLVTDVFPAFALALEPPSAGIMRQRPRSPHQALLSKSFLLLIGWQGTMLAALAFIAYLWALNIYGTGTHARSIALFALIGVQLGHMFNCRSRTRSAFSELTANPFLWLASGIVIGLQLLATYYKPLARVLDVSQLNAEDWLIVGIVILLPIVIVEVIKYVLRRQKHRQPQGD